MKIQRLFLILRLLHNIHYSLSSTTKLSLAKRFIVIDKRINDSNNLGKISDHNKIKISQRLGIKSRIVGGFQVDQIDLFPYHASYGGSCSAAIIDKRWAITAAHCGRFNYLSVGINRLNSGPKYKIVKFYIHPNWIEKYKRHPYDYDYQLLNLSKDLKINTFVQPIKIARLKDLVVGKMITVTGWGSIRESGPESDILRAVNVPLVSKQECQKVNSNIFRNKLTPRMFCAGYDEGGRDACQGDSGGPAFADNRLLGLVSFGSGCALPKSFGVYANVVLVRPWIEDTTSLILD